MYEVFSLELHKFNILKKFQEEYYPELELISIDFETIEIWFKVVSYLYYKATGDIIL